MPHKTVLGRRHGKASEGILVYHRDHSYTWHGSRNMMIDENAPSDDRSHPPPRCLAVHERWSELNRQFLEYVRDSPNALRGEAFGSVIAGSPTTYRLQAWPFFIGRTHYQHLDTLAVAVDRLARDVLRRVFSSDPEQIAKFFRSNNEAVKLAGERVFPLTFSEELITLLLEEPNDLASAPSRGDYVDTREGLKCVEFNVGGLVGGLQAETFSHLHLGHPIVGEFLRKHQCTVSPQDCLGELFRHVIKSTRHRGVWNGGPFGLAILSADSSTTATRLHSAEKYEQILRREVSDAGGDGAHVFVCDTQQLRASQAGLWVNNLRVHAVIDQHEHGSDLRLLFRSYKRGVVELFSSPLFQLLSDKRILALLSERGESNDYTMAERAVIQGHIPWTRCLRNGVTMFRGRKCRIPEDLLTNRELFVLKKATSFGGSHVRFGKLLTAPAWSTALDRGLREWDWVVQECVESEPYWFQKGTFGAEPHDVVWGLYVFGERFGGTFLRLKPKSRGDGIVNYGQGAEVGIVLNHFD